jgi:hypothetical protein
MGGREDDNLLLLKKVKTKNSCSIRKEGGRYRGPAAGIFREKREYIGPG